MCFPFDAQPPAAPAAGDAVTLEELTLTSADGTRFSATAARPATPTGAGIVVLPDVRGLFRFYKELARGFAAQGVNAVAFDYFGRTAGLGERGEEFPFMDHVRQTTAPQIAADIASVVAFLRSPAGGSCTAVFTVGFCFGGAQSWLQASNGHGLAGAIGFYGRPGPGFDGAPGPVGRAGDVRSPVLALMGGADQGIGPEQVEELRTAWQAAGVQHEIVVYPGAPHSFFDRTYKEHAAASADAWRRCLAFIGAHKAVAA